MNTDVKTSPNTREVLLDGLRLALQTKVAAIWGNVTLAGEPAPGPRFTNGIKDAIENYEKAWHYIDGITHHG